ncbi:MAG TPA: DUF1684 domain-containing protein [Terracidiphilus sp.]|nr:DUF1684 domain-containing protein [Terracidiphilus sp.]
MMRRFAISFAVALALLGASVALSPSGSAVFCQTVASQPAAASAAVPAQWQQEIAAWRSQREKEISAPDGWLALAGLEWLKPGINSVGSAANNKIHLPTQAPEHLGLFTVMDNSQSSSSKPAKGSTQAASANTTIQLLAPSGGFPPDLTMDGKPAREGTLLVDDAKPSTIAWRGLSLVVLKRGDRFVLRIKDANSPVRTSFHGLNWYPAEPRYRVTARWIPFKPPLVEEISTVIGTKLTLPAPGLAMFLIDGKVQHLEPVLEDPSGKTLFFILKDATSKTASYGGGRFLHSGLPDHGLDQPGTLSLDFNQLENPPCAYTNYATCPLPPVQNQLEVAIEAGEKRYER